jgi:hypothetical protein
MSEKPIVLALHSVLEFAALVAVGYWAWVANDGLERWVWAFAVPLLLGTVWAVFRAADDGGDPIVTVPGPVRLGLELALLGVAGALLYDAGQPAWAVGFLALVVVDYALQYDRVARLARLRH